MFRNIASQTHLRRLLMLSETKTAESSSVLVSSLCMNCWDDTNSSRGFRSVVTMRYGGVTWCRKSEKKKKDRHRSEGVTEHKTWNIEGAPQIEAESFF